MTKSIIFMLSAVFFISSLATTQAISRDLSEASQANHTITEVTQHRSLAVEESCKPGNPHGCNQ